MTDSKAVKMYRDKFKLNINVGRKDDIDKTIQDLDLWEFVLNSWGYYKNGKWVNYNPLNVGHLLSEYERLERKRESGSAIAYVEKYEHA